LAVGIGRAPIDDQTREEATVISACATEYLFLENIALKLVLEHREVPNWQKLLNHLLAEKEIRAEVRLNFKCGGDRSVEIRRSNSFRALLDHHCRRCANHDGATLPFRGVVLLLSP
jgi:hypothetical protein